jgi:catechol 2,3-dioxygenase-like lactoylglutathione lyase family enzyme
MRIGVVDVFAADQDKAGAFYTGMFGFQAKNDASYATPPTGWTVVSPGDPHGPELHMAPTSEAAAALQAARREMGAPAVSFTTQDCGGTTDRSPEGRPCSCRRPNPWATGAPTPWSRLAAATCPTSIRTEGPRCGR